MDQPVSPVAPSAEMDALRKSKQLKLRARNKRFTLGTGLVLLLLAVAGVSWRLLGQSNRITYTTAAVTRGPITRTVSATGTVNPQLTIIVGTYVSGVIQELSCDYNTVVKKGQVCAKIDPRPYQALVDQSKANLAIAKAQLVKDQAAADYAKLNYERNERLLPTKAVSQ
jgi:HlyD family secretion protein